MMGNSERTGGGGAGKRVSLGALITLGCLAAGCADLEKEKLPQIVASGMHALAVGGTLQLAPTTVNGSDKGYLFVSGSKTIADVTPGGLVTALSPGETSVTITGVDSKATATYPLVVVTDLSGLGDGGLPGDASGDGGPAVPVVPAAAVPFYERWRGSAHADPTAPAFNRWNKEGAVPVECARCHSSPGFQDYIGADATAPFRVDRPAPVGTVVDCRACHSTAAGALSQVTFPSGFTATGLGGEARCMTCHQGRASGADVDAAITKAGITNADEASPMLGFLNIHYYPAAATLYAGRAKGGYQYPGQVYDTRFRHVESHDTCIECHDPHSTRVRFDECATCHQGVSDLGTARGIRMMASAGRDYDGDGNVTEGVAEELDGARAKLLGAIQRYGQERAMPVCYSSTSYPYWFNDANGDGVCAPGEAVPAAGYKGWSPRLMRAAYNYQMATKDPGAFAHNAKYVLELLFDSIQDVNSVLTTKIDQSQSVRNDFGHFNGSSEAARRWDADEMVSADCSRCHSGQTGYRFFVQYGVSTVVPETANGLECGTCHTSFGTEFAVLDVKSTRFPSGITLAQPGYDNLCSTCHAGRAAKSTIDANIAAAKLGFVNVHYLPAASTKAGASAAVGYQYTGKTYAGPLQHKGGTQCTSCHDPKASQHTFRVSDAWQTACRGCHADANGNPEAIRLVHTADYDGDANVAEPLRAELDGMATKVLAAMRSVAAGLCYSSTAYPYFFRVTAADANLICSPTDAVAANAFKAWTPALMKAAHNYQLSRKEPGAWAHNFDYVGQLLFDSVEDLRAGATDGLVRP